MSVRDLANAVNTQCVWCPRDHLCVLSFGQTRLRELVEETARVIDPDAFWWPENGLHYADPREQQAGVMLKQLRANAMRDPVITTDAITGQQLNRPPVSRTYAEAQRYAGFSEIVSIAPIDADAILNCRGGSLERELACAGIDKPHTVYGALTWLALRRRLPSPVDANAILLLGSRIVICGSGGHHRTLACFLWGAGELAGEITLVDELADQDLHAACRLIDSRLPDPTQGVSIRKHPNGHGALRAQLLDLAERLHPLRPLTASDLLTPLPRIEDIIDALASMRPLRRRWLRRAFPRPSS
jgi:hypothetical protein